MAGDLKYYNSESASGRIDYIDGIRGVGAVIVFYYHLIVMFIGEQFTRLQPIYKSILLDGPLAVLVFFIISGIALSAASIKNPGHCVLPSLVSRYFRLAVPIFVTSLIAFGLVQSQLMFNDEVAATGRSAGWLGSFYTMSPTLHGVAQFSFHDVFFNYTLAESYNSSLWTIPFEFIGSIALYGMLLVVSKPALRRVVASVLLCILFPTETYISCFFAGYLLADVAFKVDKIRTKQLDYIGLSLLLAGVVATSVYRPNSPHYWALVAMMIVLGCILSCSVRSALSGKLGKALGKISFPLYLGHIFVICSLSSYLYIFLPSVGFSSKEAFAINILLSSVAAFGLAIILIPVENFSVFLSRLIGKQVAKGMSLVGRINN